MDHHHGLAAAIARIESSANLTAMRFETPLFGRLANGYAPAAVQNAADSNRCTRTTGMMICATSWGAYQMLGQVLYDDLGQRFTIARFLNDPAAQFECFRAFVVRNKIDFALADIRDDQAKREAFAKRYNGPGNVPAYAERLRQAAHVLLPRADA